MDEQVDSTLRIEAIKFRKELMKRFEETPIIGLKHEAYSFLFYSSHGFGKSIKFEKKISGCSVSIKCMTKKDWFTDCENYQIGISMEEWNQLERMIYEFNFWTADQFKIREGVLDGSAYFLQGNRPEAEKCNKKTVRLIGRGSVSYDKMVSLCDNIREYENQLAFKYGKRRN